MYHSNSSPTRHFAVRVSNPSRLPLTAYPGGWSLGGAGFHVFGRPCCGDAREFAPGSGRDRAVGDLDLVRGAPTVAPGAGCEARRVDGAALDAGQRVCGACPCREAQTRVRPAKPEGFTRIEVGEGPGKPSHPTRVLDFGIDDRNRALSQRVAQALSAVQRRRPETHLGAVPERLDGGFTPYQKGGESNAVDRVASRRDHIAGRPILLAEGKHDRPGRQDFEPDGPQPLARDNRVDLYPAGAQHLDLDPGRILDARYAGYRPVIKPTGLGDFVGPPSPAASMGTTAVVSSAPMAMRVTVAATTRALPPTPSAVAMILACPSPTAVTRPFLIDRRDPRRAGLPGHLGLRDRKVVGVCRLRRERDRVTDCEQCVELR